MDRQKLLELLGNVDFPLTLLDSVDSTNSYAKKCGETAPHMSSYIALRQTGGRGRLDHTFCSPEGGLYLSVLLHPDRDMSLFTAFAAVAAREAVSSVCGMDTDIKWTNDLQIGGKKVCGILTESVYVGSCIRSCVVGIGINVNTSITAYPDELGESLTSIAAHTGKLQDMEALAAAVILGIRDVYGEIASNPGRVLDRYRRYCTTIGRKVRFFRGDEYIVGRALEVDDTGALIVMSDDGNVIRLSWGEVSVF